MPMSEGKSLRGKVIATSAIGLAIVLGILVIFAIDRRPRTHDARIFAYSAAMASEISGRIVQILITNDQDVAKGAPLLVIDPPPYEFQLRQARAQVEFVRRRINDEERRALSNILIIRYEDLDNSSTDLRRHRRAVGKDTRIVCARPSIDREDDENAEDDSQSDCRRGNHLSAKRLAFTHWHLSRQPYQPHCEGACTGNRQHDD